MTATEAILNYAAIHGGSFHRKGLIQDIVNLYADIKVGSIDLQLNRLMSSGMLRHKGHGEYALAENNLPEFVYRPSETEKVIYRKLKSQFPFLDICIWSPRVLSSFMLHIPDIGYIFVDVEKDGMESVFYALQSMDMERNILLAPSTTDCDRYLTGSDAIVVRQLIGQSPLTVVDGCAVPRIEKILVDAIGDNELLFASGSEIYNIFEYAQERNNVNKRKLLRYASRRNRKDKVEQILKTMDVENDQTRK